jgi:hypothetical protein
VERVAGARAAVATAEVGPVAVAALVEGMAEATGPEGQAAAATGEGARAEEAA